MVSQIVKDLAEYEFCIIFKMLVLNNFFAIIVKKANKIQLLAYSPKKNLWNEKINMEGLHIGFYLRQTGPFVLPIPISAYSWRVV